MRNNRVIIGFGKFQPKSDENSFEPMFKKIVQIRV